VKRKSRDGWAGLWQNRDGRLGKAQSGRSGARVAMNAGCLVEKDALHKRALPVALKIEHSLVLDLESWSAAGHR
jgi:hypothetical protein